MRVTSFLFVLLFIKVDIYAQTLKDVYIPVKMNDSLTPSISLDGMYFGGDIPKKYFSNIDGFVSLILNYKDPPKCLVESYKVEIKSTGVTHQYHVKGALIPDSLKSIFAELSDNDTVCFFDIDISQPCRFSNDTFRFNVRTFDLNILIYTLRLHLEDDGRDSKVVNALNDIPTTSLFKTQYACNKDTCSYVLISKSTGCSQKSVKVYQYKGEVFKVEFWNKGEIVLSINCSDNIPNGVFTFYYDNGKKYVVGEFEKYTLANSDTVVAISPVTFLENHKIFKIESSRKAGQWLFYNRKGYLTRKDFY